VSYLIGIQENREEGHHDVPDAADGGLTGTSGDTRAGRDRLATLPEDSIKMMSHQTCSGFSGSDSFIDEADIRVWVNAASPTLTVLSCSSDFSLLAGPRGTCREMSQWLSSSHLRKVKSLVRQGTSSPVDVRLSPEGGWSYQCALSVDAMPMPAAAPSSSQPVCLVVDSLVCKISKSKNKVASTYDLELWASADDVGKLCITHAIGNCQQLVDDLLANSDLGSWLHADFIRALVPILEKLTAAERNVLPHRMGSFTLRSPGQGPSPWDLNVSVTFVDDGEQHEQDLLCHFGLEVASEQQRRGPLATRFRHL